MDVKAKYEEYKKELGRDQVAADLTLAEVLNEVVETLKKLVPATEEPQAASAGGKATDPLARSGGRSSKKTTARK